MRFTPCLNGFVWRKASKIHEYIVLSLLIQFNDLDFIQVENEGDSKEAIVANVSQGLKDVKKLQDGNLKTRPAKALLDELSKKFLILPLRYSCVTSWLS